MSHASFETAFSTDAPTPINNESWLDTRELAYEYDYSGHLLVDTDFGQVEDTGDDCANTPAGHEIITPADSTPRDRVQPVVFDSSVLTDVETKPWWNHLIPRVNVPPLSTAQEMFEAYQDPLAEYRRRMDPAPVTSKAQNNPAMALAPFASALATPPGQLYQKFEYDDALLSMPAPDVVSVCDEATGNGERGKKAGADEEEEDTPPELIEAAVAALMTHSSTHQDGDVAVAPATTVEQPNWNTPVSATFVPPEYHAFPSMSHDPASAQGVVRHRAHTFADGVPAWLAAPAGTSDFYSAAMANGMPVPTPDQAATETGSHPCLWLGCHQRLPNAAALTHHVNRYHIARRQPAHRCLWQGCNRANHIFRHRDKILIHIRLHTKDRPWQCGQCQKQFSRADSLEAHRKVHAAEGKSWQCRAPGCGRMYFHAKSLKKHERTAHDLDLEL